MDAAREYLVDQLVIAATWLTESHIYRKDPERPLCQLCLMSGVNGRPVPHLSSCPVGRVLRAIEELKPLDKPSAPVTAGKERRCIDCRSWASQWCGKGIGKGQITAGYVVCFRPESECARLAESPADVDAYLDAKDAR